MIKKCLSIRVYGKVQGVWYRGSTQQKAQALNLLGWVKNETDGSVSILAEGPSESMDLFVEWCQQGPTHARVDRVDIQEQTLQHFTGFQIIRR